MNVLQDFIGHTVVVRFANGQSFDGELVGHDDVGLSLMPAAGLAPGAAGDWPYFIPWTAVQHVSRPPAREERSVPIALAQRQRA